MNSLDHLWLEMDTVPKRCEWQILETDLAAYADGNGTFDPLGP